MKRIGTIIVILLLCVLCVVGIALIGSGKTAEGGAGNIDNVQPINDFFRKEYTVVGSSIVIDEKLDGMIDSLNGLRIETLTADASSVSTTELQELQGSIIKRGDLIMGDVEAPFTGKVDMVTQQGETVLITVVQYEDMYVSFSVPQEYLKLVKVGDTLSFEYCDGEHNGTINYISQYIDDGYAKVHLRYNDPRLDLLINSSVTITLVIERLDDVIVIPQNAVMLNSEGNTTVKVVNGENDIEIVVVECGRTYGDMVVITSGLFEGMRLVIDIASNGDSSVVGTDNVPFEQGDE